MHQALVMRSGHAETLCQDEKARDQIIFLLTHVQRRWGLVAHMQNWEDEESINSEDQTWTWCSRLLASEERAEAKAIVR